MIHCIDCTEWDTRRAGYDGQRLCQHLSTPTMLANSHGVSTRPDFGCVDGKERKPQGPWSFDGKFIRFKPPEPSGKIFLKKDLNDLVDFLNEVWPKEQERKCSNCRHKDKPHVRGDGDLAGIVCDRWEATRKEC